MFGVERRGFDWKEIAEVFRTTAVAPATFWRAPDDAESVV